MRAPSRFLQLVETRLAQLESDVRFLKDQQSQSGSVRSEPIMADRRDSLATSVYHFAVPVPEQDPEDYGVSPDATDGIGSIEFTKEVDSGYYGEWAQQPPDPDYQNREICVRIAHEAVLALRAFFKYRLYT